MNKGDLINEVSKIVKTKKEVEVLRLVKEKPEKAGIHRLEQ